MNWFNRLNKTGKSGVIVILAAYLSLLILGFFIKPILAVMIAFTVISFVLWAISFLIALFDGDFNE